MSRARTRRPVPSNRLALAAALALAAGGPQALADSRTDEVSDEALEEVVEERAKEEATDGVPADADVGEASYNIVDCQPANGRMADVDAEEGAEEGAEGDGDVAAVDDASDGEADVADSAVAQVEEKELDPCRDMDK